MNDDRAAKTQNLSKLTPLQAIALLHHRLLRNSRLHAAVILAGTFGYSFLLMAVFFYCFGPKSAFFAVLPLMAIHLAAIWYYRESLTPGSDQAARMLDGILRARERVVTLHALTTQTLSAEEQAKKEFIEGQLTASLSRFDAGTAAPFVLRGIIKAFSLSGVLAFLCGFMLMFQAPLWKAPHSGAAEASMLKELLKQEPDLPEPLKEKIERLAESLDNNAINSSDVREALNAAQKELEQERISLQRNKDGKTASNSSNMSQAPELKQSPQKTVPPTATPTPQAGTKQQEEKQQDKQQNEEKENKSDKQQGEQAGKQDSQSQKEGKEQSKDKQGQTKGGDSKEEGDGKGSKDSQQGQGGQDGGQDQNKNEDKGGKSGKSGKQEASNQQQGQNGQQQQQQDGQQQNQSLNNAQKALDQVKNKIDNQKDQKSGQGQSQGDQKKEAGEKKGDQNKSGDQQKEQQQQSGQQGDKNPSQNQDQKPDKKQSGEQKEEPKQGETGAAGSDQKNEKKQEPQEKKQDEKPKGKDDSKKGAGESALPDRNAKMKEMNEGELGQEGPGLGGKKQFKDQIFAPQQEQYDTRHTGKDADLSRNDKEAGYKTELSDIKAARPDAAKERSKQPIPLEYQDILR